MQRNFTKILRIFQKYKISIQKNIVNILIFSPFTKIFRIEKMSRNKKDDLTEKFNNSFHKIAANVKLVHILTSNRTKIKHVKIRYCYKYLDCAREDNSCLANSCLADSSSV